jgi:putative DNA primase/helicase
MALRGKRFVWASESNEGRKLDSGKVKALTGGDTITARAPYAKFQVTFPPTHQLFLITNHAPVMDPDDRALWYRVSFIHFPLSFVEKPKAIFERQRDKYLLCKLRAETSGIIAWVVRGYKAYIDEGMGIPGSVQITTSEYRNANDHIGLFVSECLERSEGGKVPYKAAYKAYVKWAEDSKLKPMARPLFKLKIAPKIGEFKRSGAGYYYKGYKLIKAV